MISNSGAGDDLRVLCSARRSNQAILKEINPKYSLEGLILKLQYFGHLMQRAGLLEKTLILERLKTKEKGQQRIKWLDSITDSMDINVSKIVKDRGAWPVAVHGVAKNQT